MSEFDRLMRLAEIDKARGKVVDAAKACIASRVRCDSEDDQCALAWALYVAVDSLVKLEEEPPQFGENLDD